MTPAEFFDKEHGTTRALERRPMSDSVRNEWLSQFDGADIRDPGCPDCGQELVEQTRPDDEPWACLQCGWEGDL